MEMCLLLDKYKCDWEAEDYELRSPLFYVLNNINLLTYLVKEKKVKINKYDLHGRSAFYKACCEQE